MVVVPGESPDTTPVVGLTVAVSVAVLDQVPPADELPRLVVPPAQTVRVPVMGPGATVPTVNVVVAVQEPMV